MTNPQNVTEDKTECRTSHKYAAPEGDCRPRQEAENLVVPVVPRLQAAIDRERFFIQVYPSWTSRLK